MTREQAQDFIELQDWRLFEGDCVDKWELEKEGVRIHYEHASELEGDLFPFYEVETIDGETIEVVGTPCYTFELGWGLPTETWNMDTLKASPYWAEKMKHG